MVGHHHTLLNVDGQDHQILVEADYIVNVTEKRYKRKDIMKVMHAVVRTESGIRILKDILMG